MNFKRISLVCSLIYLISACAFVPQQAKVEPHKAYLKNNCQTKTKKLTLALKDISPNLDCVGTEDDLIACLVLGGFITTTSAVVSGSIVIIGNALHWVEHKMKCD